MPKTLPVSDPASLSPLELFALSRVAKEKALKDARPLLPVAAGQAVDFLVRIRGSIDVAAGQTATVTEAPKLAPVLKIVFAALGPANRAKVQQALVDTYHRADALELPLEAEHLAKTVIGLLSVEREQQRNGNVTGSVTAEVIPTRVGNAHACGRR